jgi:hypothetical protein
LPKGFEVKTNALVLNDEGVSIAEFDIEISGKIGTGDIRWLIECRDRPAQGPAPGSWIEQLVGRRTRFGFNKITAVSTSGFSAGAREFAQQSGIDIREVESLEPSAFAEWLQISSLTQRLRISNLHHAELLGGTNLKETRALQKFLRNGVADLPFLKSTKTGVTLTAQQAFLNVVNQAQGIFDDVLVGDSGKLVALDVSYPKDDHYVVNVRRRSIAINRIRFRGELFIQESEVPIIEKVEYRHAISGNLISQLAAFAPQNLPGISFSVEMHRLAETGETQVLLRRLNKAR